MLDSEYRVLDGRNRLAACAIAGVLPEGTVYTGDDPAGYALAVNLDRRSLSKGQKAMVLARAAGLSQTTVRDAAQTVAVSHSRLVYATTVLTHAPDLADSVVSGATALIRYTLTAGTPAPLCLSAGRTSRR